MKMKKAALSFAILTFFVVSLFKIATAQSRVEYEAETTAETETEAETVKETEEETETEAETEAETVAKAETEAETVAKVETDNLECLGEYTITAYCHCEKCCGKSDGITATGTETIANRTVAVDARNIPHGTRLVIDGIEYVAEDSVSRRIADKYDGKIIDIYFATHEEALNYGKQIKEVFIK